jgi:hypothetical protein
MITSYEEQLATIQGLKRTSTETDRFIEWSVTGGPVGVARTPTGRVEIFLTGPPLEARYRRVREAMEHQTWFRADGDELLANRILLPLAGHFEPVAAFLCIELLRNGAVEDLPEAFSRTEPLIDLAIGDLLLSDETFLGLCGEVLVLHSLMRAASDDVVVEVIESWKGYRETPRDFQLGGVGVEVKTTTGQSSSHHFAGVHQLEVGHGVDGVEESSFFLLSLGLEWAHEEDEVNATTVPELVDALIDRLRRAPGGSGAALVDQLVERLATYGSPTPLGYDHRTARESARFSRPLRLHFARGYDMTDEAIRLLTTEDLRARPFIDEPSLFLRVNLPNQVTGDLNPVIGLARCSRRVLASRNAA